MKAHTNPTAQYTLVTIRGRNSNADAPTSTASEWSEVASTGVDFFVRSGNRVTNIWRSGKQARYNLSRTSITTNGKDLGNLDRLSVIVNGE